MKRLLAPIVLATASGCAGTGTATPAEAGPTQDATTAAGCTPGAARACTGPPDGAGIDATGNDVATEATATTGDDAGGDAARAEDAAGDGSTGAGAAEASTADGAPGSGDGGGASCASPCPSGQKPCRVDRNLGTGSGYSGTLCVSTSDPAFGCASPSCAPCNVPLATSVTCTSAGVCAGSGCPPDLVDCDGIASNGCEADLDTPQNCGACGHACASGQVCDQGTCAASCTFPRANCSGACRDLTSDPRSCASCGNVCPYTNATSAACSNSTCSVTCAANASLCGGSCNLQSFVAVSCFSSPNCGAGCGTSCTDPQAGSAACAAGAWTTQCFAGYSKCAGTCVDERSDSANCGACGAACGSGKTCVSGSCAPLSTIEIVTGLTAPEDIVVDATNVYFTDAGGNTVWQVDKSTLASTRLGSINEAKPWRLAVDTTNVYWTSNQGGAIRTAPIGGGPGRTLYSVTQPTAIAVDDAYVYWSDGGAGYVYKAPKNPDAGAPTALARATADEFKIDSASLYAWGSTWNASLPGYMPTVYQLDKVSGALTTYAFVPGANDTATRGVAINSHTVFWLWSGWSSTGLPSLEDAPKGVPSSSVALVDNLPSLTAYLAADDCSVYWTTGAGGIGSATLAGGGARTLTFATSASHRLAVDDANIYWTDSTWIGRIPK